MLATQNPIEQEGTYPLPEAQVDRFMLKLKMDYPTKAEEHQILKLRAGTAPLPEVSPVMGKEEISALRRLADTIYMDEKIEEYIVNIVGATRTPEEYDPAIEAADPLRGIPPGHHLSGHGRQGPCPAPGAGLCHPPGRQGLSAWTCCGTG